MLSGWACKDINYCVQNGTEIESESEIESSSESEGDDEKPNKKGRVKRTRCLDKTYVN